MNPSGRGTSTVGAVSGGGLFVGRETVLGRLGAMLDAAASGQGGIAMVAGDPGLGKTRLLRAVADTAFGRGFQVGSAANFENARSPFAPLMDGLRGVLDGHIDALPRAAADRTALLALMGAEDADPPATLDKRRLFVTVADTLTRLAQRVPWLILIDDAQWSDPESLEFIEYLAPRISMVRGAVVVAYRAAADDRHLLTMSTRIANVEHWTLEPLTLMESRLLITSFNTRSRRLGQDVVDDIAVRAEGNPLFLEELSRVAGQGGAISAGSVAQTTAAKLTQLEPSSRSVVEAAAVIGREFDIEMLVIVTGSVLESSLAALRSAKDAAIIEEVNGVPTLFRFRHELIRRAIYDRLLEMQRRELHRRVATELASRQSQSELLATHLLAAGELEAGARAAESAGDQAAAVDALASARDRYLAAENTQTFSGPDLARLAEKLGRALDLLGDSEQAARRLANAASYFEAQGAADRASSLWQRFAFVTHRSQNVHEALDACRRAAALAQSTTTSFSAHALMAMIYAFDEAFDDAIAQIQAAEAVAEPHNIADHISLEYAKLAVARFQPGDAWAAPAQQAITYAESTADSGLITHALINYGVLAQERGRTSDGIAVLNRAAEIADRNGRILAAAYARRALIDALAFGGQLTDAYRVVLEAAALHVQTLNVRLGLAEASVPVLVERKVLQKFPQIWAAGLAEEARDLGDLRGYVMMKATEMLVAAFGYSTQSDPAAEDAVVTAESVSNVDSALLIFARFAPDSTLDRVESLAAVPGPNMETRVYRSATRALVSLRTKRPDAKNDAREAIEIASLNGAPLIAALVMSHAGRDSEAHDIYVRHGALASAERLQGALKSRLTAREHDIALLLSGGKSNREIAAALILSERTVEHHVAAILRKLDCSRREVAAKLSGA